MKPKVSVIIPVYYAEAWLEQCLESLAAQTLDSLEIVLVDDHGGDRSMELAHEFAEGKGAGLRFVFEATPCNSGPGAARNLGISRATGDYVAFVDSDDTVEPDFCRKLWEAATAVDADLACCDINISGKIHRNPDADDKRHFLRHFVTYFTTFIYRRSMLLEKDLFFPHTSSAEDTCFLTCCLLCANKIAQVKEPLYNYLMRQGSLSTCKSRRRAVQRLSSIWKMMVYSKEHGVFKPYSMEIKIIALKKGYLLSLKDLITG